MNRQQFNWALRSPWRYEDDPEVACPVHGAMTRAYHGDRLAFIACRTCQRTPADFLTTRHLRGNAA